VRAAASKPRRTCLALGCSLASRGLEVDHAVAARRCSPGQGGLMPAWTMEGPDQLKGRRTLGSQQVNPVEINLGPCLDEGWKSFDEREMML
jgi:hypothetical protein